MQFCAPCCRDFLQFYFFTLQGQSITITGHMGLSIRGVHLFFCILSIYNMKIKYNDDLHLHVAEMLKKKHD